MAEKKERIGTYEAMFLFGAGAAAELEGTINTAKGFIERHGGKIILAKKWDERKLAYELNKNKRGVYIIAYFTAPKTAINAIERDVRLSESALRVLITTADHLSEDEMHAVEPQPIQAPAPREERSFGYGGDFGGGYDRPARAPREGAGKE
jgi:small subunit ribosomal protein S6